MDLKIQHSTKDIIIMFILAALILAVYWPVQDYKFISYDDYMYVTENYRIQSGIDIISIADTFRDVHTGHWHPLTMMSHMVDWQLFGYNAGGHHWTNVIIHIFNTLLLFLFFRYLTSAIWRSAFIAALFAIHPLNVESIAWIAERKNVLSTFFWILTMMLYVWYVKSPNWKRYLPMFVSFALGLMSKPMLVTLPFVLLLLDYWPLNRISFNSRDEDRLEISTPFVSQKLKISSLMIEKIPLFILTIISTCLTIYAALYVKMVANLEALPLTKRISNAIISYALYIKKLFLPYNLAVFYPPSKIDFWQASFTALLMFGITITVFKFYRKYPYLLVGWLWYLGTLVPVIGLLQVGAQAMADRYTYIPLIGIFIIMAWGLFDLTMERRKGNVIFSAIAVLIIAIMAVLTSIQVSYWKNNVTLYSHAIEVTKNNYLANNNLGAHFIDIGDYKQAYFYITTAIQINPKYADAHRNLAVIFIEEGKKEKAINHFKEAIKIKPNYTDAIRRLADVLARDKQFEEAKNQYIKLLTYDPADYEAYNNLGAVLVQIGKVDDAIVLFRKALYLKADYIIAKRNLEIVLRQKNQEKIY
jgi:protein O-mannosyl-transferase